MPSASIPAIIGLDSAAAAAATAGTAAELVTPAVAAADAAATAGGISTLATASSGLSLANLAAGASLASSALGGFGALQQGRAAAAAAGYNAKLAAQNAELQTQSAGFAGAQGEQEVGIQGAKNKASLAAALANQGASGVDVNTGSSVDVRESEAKLGMLNALTIRSNAVKQAYGFQVGAESQRAQSELFRKQQEGDTTGGYLNAGSTVLGGIGSAAKYTDWLNSGGFNG